jgi:hypothetical protein
MKLRKITSACGIAFVVALSLSPLSSTASDMNPNIDKWNKMFDMLRKQGKLPTQVLEEAPEDSYDGSDADDLKDIVREDYEKNYKEDEVLDVRIQMDDWERRKEERWHDINRAYYEVDISTLQALVFVRKDADNAYIIPFDFTKDHADGDKLTWDSKSSRVLNALVQEVAISKM